jgi:hypothetical protein
VPIINGGPNKGRIINHDTGDEDSGARCPGVWGDAHGFHQCGQSHGHPEDCVADVSRSYMLAFKTDSWPEFRWPPC